MHTKQKELWINAINVKKTQAEMKIIKHVILISCMQLFQTHYMVPLSREVSGSKE